MLHTPSPLSDKLLLTVHEATGIVISSDITNGEITFINHSILPDMLEEVRDDALQKLIHNTTELPLNRCHPKNFPIKLPAAIPDDLPDFIIVADLDRNAPINTILYTGALPGCHYPCIISQRDIDWENAPHIRSSAPFFWHSPADIPTKARDFIIDRATDFAFSFVKAYYRRLDKASA